MAELVRAGRVLLAHFVRVGKLLYGRHVQGLLGEIVRSGSPQWFSLSKIFFAAQHKKRLCEQHER
jgi:hypothetical protein